MTTYLSLVLQKKEMVHGEFDELDKLIRHKNLINYIKTQRLSWFGHLHRMSKGEWLKKYIRSK